MPDSSDNPLTSAETAFLRALDEVGLRYMLVGLAAAVVQGADTVTQDLDLWFESLDTASLQKAAAAAGGFFTSRTQPPMIGGDGLDRIDIVTHCDGLETFDEEYGNTLALTIEDFEVRVLKLERIIASKQAAGRPKDQAVMHQLRAALAASRDRGA